MIISSFLFLRKLGSQRDGVNKTFRESSLLLEFVFFPCRSLNIICVGIWMKHPQLPSQHPSLSVPWDWLPWYGCRSTSIGGYYSQEATVSTPLFISQGVVTVLICPELLGDTWVLSAELLFCIFLIEDFCCFSNWLTKNSLFGGFFTNNFSVIYRTLFTDSVPSVVQIIN